MSLFPAIGTELPDAANGVAAPVSTQTFNDNGPHSHTQAPLRYGGGRVPHPGHRVEEEEEGSLGENHLHSETDQRSRTHSTDSKRHVKSSHKSRASKASLAAAATHTTDAGRHTQSSKARHTPEPPGAALRWAPVSAEETQSLGDDGEMEKQDGEEDEKERQWVGQHAEPGEELGSSRRYSSSAPGPSSCGSSSSARPPPPPPEESPCPPHVMAQVRVRNVPERERIVRGMQDSKSLDEISQACGADCSGPILRSRGSARRPADIPPIDPAVLLDLERHTQEVARSVELMMRGLNGAIQNMTALSVGYIQTYRDSVDSLGESVDMSIKGMYTLMARCEELDRSMKPIHTLAAQIHDIKRTLDALEAICK